MDYTKLYRCKVCGTTRYLIFPNKNETLIICSGCYREQNILLEEQSKGKEKIRFRCSNFYCPIP